jgi:flagellar motor switch protein FliM
MSICDFHPFHGQFIIEMNPKIAFTMVERTFGGVNVEENNRIREFTDIEEVVLKKMTKRFLESFSEAWENVADLRPRLKELESNPQFTQIVPGNDMVILATFNTEIGQTEGLINICIPYIVLEPIVSKLSAQYMFTTSARSGEAKEKDSKELKRGLTKAELPVQVDIGKTHITVGQLMQLNKGDVLRLDTKAEDDVVIEVSGREKFKATPGKSGSKTAVEITKNISGEEIDLAWLQEIVEEEGENNGG